MITKFLRIATMLFIPGIIGSIWNLIQGDMRGACFWGSLVLIAFIAGTVGGLLMRGR
jgi:hypothetical protein